MSSASGVSKLSCDLQLILVLKKFSCQQDALDLEECDTLPAEPPLLENNRLPLNGHLYKTDNSVKRTPRVRPFLILLPLFDSLNKTDIYLRPTRRAGPKCVRLRERKAWWQSAVSKKVKRNKLKDPVVRRGISANPGLNFNPGLLFLCSKAFFSGIIFSILFRASNHQVVCKKNKAEFAF